jgi:gamma-glutamylcyclotransferase (GGCT)/AIG2-like uncharacterized protein YtfP
VLQLKYIRTTIIAMKPQSSKLFVYGSLRSGFHHPAYEYISRYFALIGDAKVKGQLYDMGNYPAALPAQADTFIVGELYQLNNENEYEWAFEQLDDYEGVFPEEGEQALYKREVTSVYIHDRIEEAYIYWFNGSVEGNPKVASGDVLQYIQQKSKI